jgi:hypothetical protein
MILVMTNYPWLRAGRHKNKNYTTYNKHVVLTLQVVV